jgi:regulatory protein
LGYLNDLEYGRLLARRLVERQGAGPERLRAALAARGLSAEVVAAASAEALAEVDEAAAALAAARRRLRGLRGIASRDPGATRRRLAGFLSRRGYGAEAIAQTLRTLLAQAPGGDPEEN